MTGALAMHPRRIACLATFRQSCFACLPYWVNARGIPKKKKSEKSTKYKSKTKPQYRISTSSAYLWHRDPARITHPSEHSPGRLAQRFHLCSMTPHPSRRSQKGPARPTPDYCKSTTSSLADATRAPIWVRDCRPDPEQPPTRQEERYITLTHRTPFSKQTRTPNPVPTATPHAPHRINPVCSRQVKQVKAPGFGHPSRQFAVVRTVLAAVVTPCFDQRQRLAPNDKSRGSGFSKKDRGDLRVGAANLHFTGRGRCDSNASMARQAPSRPNAKPGLRTDMARRGQQSAPCLPQKPPPLQAPPTTTLPSHPQPRTYRNTVRVLLLHLSAANDQWDTRPRCRSTLCLFMGRYGQDSDLRHCCYVFGTHVWTRTFSATLRVISSRYV